jgi:hypothetical protein
MSTTTYRGLADAHGIETFCPADSAPFWLGIRAAANRQRHALVFEVDIDDACLKIVNERLEAKDWKGALIVIKLLDGIRVEKSMEESFQLIPNSKLDPWGGDRE